MTQKSRRRKLEKKLELKTYLFDTNTRTVQIKAHNTAEAKQKFQEKFGYWPKMK